MLLGSLGELLRLVLLFFLFNLGWIQECDLKVISNHLVDVNLSQEVRALGLGH